MGTRLVFQTGVPLLYMWHWRLVHVISTVQYDVYVYDCDDTLPVWYTYFSVQILSAVICCFRKFHWASYSHLCTSNQLNFTLLARPLNSPTPSNPKSTLWKQATVRCWISLCWARLGPPFHGWSFESTMILMTCWSTITLCAWTTTSSLLDPTSLLCQCRATEWALLHSHNNHADAMLLWGALIGGL